MSVYYNPEDYGLEVVTCLDFSDGNYCFDYRVIWRHKETGMLYTARDAGCSCPSPFESYTSIETLDKFNPFIVRMLIEEAECDDFRGGIQERKDYIENLKVLLNGM